MSDNTELMTPRQLWLVFGLVGLIAGAMSIYFSYPAWAFAIVIATISLAFSPRAASAGGALGGIGIGSAAMLWWATRCPPATSCEPAFAIEPFVAFAVVTLIVGAGLSLLLASRYMVRRTPRTDSREDR